MNIRMCLLGLLLAGVCTSTAQQHNSPSWKGWSWLLGQWDGKSAGKPGMGVGAFTLKESLDGAVLVRESKADFPAQGNKPAVRHTDLMVVFPNPEGEGIRASYFDNEGHILNYSVTVKDSTIVFLSDLIPGVPQFRLTYRLTGSNKIDITFEVSQGERFVKYVEGPCRRVKK